MEKKLHTLFFSLLVLVYISTNIGGFVYYHYCGGELEKVSALVKVKSCCGGTDEEDGNGCCKNESRHISLKLEFNTGKSSQPDFTLPLMPVFYLLQPNRLVLNDHSPAFVSSLYSSKHPPDPVAILLVRASIFRI